jgi:threonine dehydrogenase-like Zn-dependent dehydrogenase
VPANVRGGTAPRDKTKGLNRMRAVFLPGGKRTEMRAIEVPEPGPGEVLIALKAAGLCGSDLHMHYRPAPESRRGPIFGLVTDPEIVPGHEAAGVVVKVGPVVDALRAGDRVAVHHIGGCGDGGPFLCVRPER